MRIFNWKHPVILLQSLLFLMSSCQDNVNPGDGDTNPNDDLYTPITHHEGTALGANFNERIVDVIPEHLVKENVEWVRVFVNVSRFLTTDGAGTITGINEQLFGNYQEMAILKNLSNYNVNGRRIKIIFSYKYDFKWQNIGVPQVGTTEANYIIDISKRLLEKSNIGADIDILVVGNEPMWETENADVDKLVNFTNFMVSQADTWRKTKSDWNFDIYTGALNRVSDIGLNNPILRELIQLTKSNSAVDGLDIHSHVMSYNEIDEDVNWLRNTQGFTKNVIVTEFSLHRLLESRLNDQLGPWGTENGYQPSMRIRDWLNHLLSNSSSNPIDPSEFRSMFESRSWYQDNWFSQYFSNYCENDIRVATYGYRRATLNPVEQLGESSPAWVINGLLNDGLLGLDEDGIPVRNPLIHNEFSRIINRSSTTSCNW